MIKNILFLMVVFVVFSNPAAAALNSIDPALKDNSEGPGSFAAKEEAPKVANCEVCKTNPTPIRGRHPALTSPLGTSDKSTEASGTK